MTVAGRKTHQRRPGLVRLAVLGAAAVLLSSLAGCRRSATDAAHSKNASPARVAIRVQTDWYPQAEHGGFYQALARGFYAEAGLDVTILPGGPGARTSAKIVAGAADIGIHRSDDLMVQVAEGLPFVIVGAFMQRDPQALLLHEDDPAQDFRDLDGRTIMAMPGTNWIRFLQQRYAIDFQIVPMSYSLAQFAGDRSLIQQCFITNEPYFARQQGVRVKTLLLAGSGYEPYRVIFTTQRFLAQHPEAVRAFVAASLRGWADFMHGDPAPANAMISARNEQMSEAMLQYSIAAMREHQLVTGDAARGERIGRLDEARLREQLAMLVELGIVTEAPPLERFIRSEQLQAEDRP